MAKKNKGGRPTNRPDAQWLMMIYKNYTSKEIAEMFDVSTSTVRSWIHRIKKAAGKPRWRPETVKKILQNEKYIGDALL